MVDKSFSSLSSTLQSYQLKPKNQYISQEYQSYGCFLAAELQDPEHTSLYIKMAKRFNRGLLETARGFVKDANAKNKAKLFMWKVGQLKVSFKDDEKKVGPKPKTKPKQLSWL